MVSAKTAKTPASEKRTALPRLADYSDAFLKDWNRLSASGRYSLAELKKVMLFIIANDGPLSAEWKDHPLKGDKRNNRECHIGGDFLLIYRLDDSDTPAMVVFARAGTHSELFGR